MADVYNEVGSRYPLVQDSRNAAKLMFVLMERGNIIFSECVTLALCFPAKSNPAENYPPRGHAIQSGW